ncbi:hypothetical protein [Methylobacterium persicinum]|uniref:Uncharacterized protein n=1 Tax=Methylobacterium persicinum TaxID=374426 RepID=A0ABU0HJN4_9HYPH|nr:hypothetical protein [Methylobacterium persicinum]MDQ0441704.1 hypothetical protein [Methylobacterium persicinum]GJE39873.1 hypothetical protein KHHGKMAE_3961 [Methylobacterium persicinum]
MSCHLPVEEIRRLAAAGKIGAIVVAEQVIDTHAAGFADRFERSVALDALLRDLARLRRREPHLDEFITEVEGYIDGLHRDLDRLAA